jgi:glycosyltransferase involved in cell wall biosynthesis
MNRQLTDVTIGAVIPIIPAHKKYFPSLVKNLLLMDRNFDSIVFVASGFSNRQFRSMVKGDDFSGEQSIHFVRVGPGSAGKNRNIGWAKIDTDLICFLDADDNYPYDRTRIIEEIMVESSLDALVHAFSILNGIAEMQPIRDADSVLVRESSIFDATFADQTRERQREIADLTWESTIKTAASGGFEVHHGHVTVRRDLSPKIRFHEFCEHRNEDSVFVRDLVWEGLNVGAISLSLSNYRPATSGHFFTLKYVRKEVISFIHTTARRAMSWRK